MFERDNIERRNNIGMTYAGRETRFVEKHGHELRIFCKLRMKPLDRHRARKPHGTQKPPHVHRGHPAVSDFIEQRVSANDSRLDHKFGGRRGMLHFSLDSTGTPLLSRKKLYFPRNPLPPKRVLSAPTNGLKEAVLV